MSREGDSPRFIEVPDELLSASKEEAPISLTDTLEIGLILEYLQRAAKHHEEYEIGQERGNKILGSLTKLEELLKNSSLETSVTGQVLAFHNTLSEEYDDPTTHLSNQRSEELQQKTITWQHLLREDIGREKRIPVDDIGLLDAERLIEDPEDLFDRGVWEWLDEQPSNDIREACRTLVIGSSTASVMLSLRAAEHCLRKWYEQEQEPIEAAWGRVLDRLMEEYAEEDKRNDTVLTQLSDLPPVLSNLYYLKEKRNKVNHPEESPGPYEAQRTLMIVASTITDIYNEAYQEKVEQIDEFRPSTTQMPIDPGIINKDDDIYDVFYKAIREMGDNFEEGVPMSAVYDFGNEIDVKRSTVDNIIQELLMKGRMYEPTSDRLRVI